MFYVNLRVAKERPPSRYAVLFLRNQAGSAAWGQAAQSGDGSLIDIYFGSIGKSIREPSPD